MKKALLSAVAIAATALAGWANEYTFVFDGNNDMGGLTRQTSTKEADLTFSKTFALTEDGIDLKVADNSETGLGFALVNAGGTNAGLCVYSTMSKKTIPEISLTVPGGTINSVKLVMSGAGLISLDIPFNGTVIEPEMETPLYSWTWKDKQGAETVSFSWENAYNVRYIHSIEVSYTPDLGGKEACGLEFRVSEFEAVLGESFTSPTLVNPNKLDVIWTSSDEAVATVDAQGKLTLVGKGTTTINAATEGNDQFGAGNAKYILTVLPSAANLAELLKEAPAVYDRVKVNFPVTVNFGNLSFAYVTDAEGNAACIDNTVNRNSSSTSATTIYNVGDVIPAGWIATNATQYESVIWEGQPGKVTETVEVKYASVKAVTPADADRVVILKNVTFTERTAEGYTKVYGTTPDGTRYEFQDTFGTSAKPAGTYDVTCVVRYSKRGTTEYFYLAPIAYSEPSGEEPASPVFPESFGINISFDGAEVSQGEEFGVYTVNVNGKTSEATYTISVDVPEGWSGFIGMRDLDFNSEADPMKKVQASEWESLDTMLASGFKETNALTFPADGEEHMGFLYLYAGDQVDVANCVQIYTTVESEGSAVIGIEAAKKAEYYNVNGVRVANPGKGLYIKVVDGKAVKSHKR